MSDWQVPNPDFVARVQSLFAATPFVQHLGIALHAAEPGRCTTHMQLLPEHLQQNGYVHAGVLATLADHTAGGAACTVAAANLGVLSVEFKINMLRPSSGPGLVCLATVLKAGQRFSVVEAEVYASRAPDKILCKATVTLALVAAEDPVF